MKMGTAYIDFSDYGYDGYLPIAVYEMELLLRGAEQMLEERNKEAAQMMDRLATDLWMDAFQEKITRVWITKAAMLIAMRGLRGEKIPDIRYWHD